MTCVNPVFKAHQLHFEDFTVLTTAVKLVVHSDVYQPVYPKLDMVTGLDRHGN